LVAAHDALPIARLWGHGDVASADGVRFVVRGEPIHAGYNPRYFGRKRGVTWYNLVSNQSTGLSGIVVPGTLRDSMVILGLLLEQETHLDPDQVITDTAAYSDVVFGLFWLLGYRFSPRLADIGGARLWRIDRKADYDAFNPLSRNRIDTDLVIAAWPDLLRLAGSLKLGRIKAAAVMRILQVKERPTPLARALVELGRIIKTIHVLDYIDDADRRRRILVQLNKQEFRHRLARRVCHGNRGELAAGYREGQEETLGALGLLLNVIAFWNATYMQAAVEALEAGGHPIDQAHIARVSPLAYRHINFLGRYTFTLPEAVARGQLRPLRDPNSE
jgi:TnpA family transposase